MAEEKMAVYINKMSVKALGARPNAVVAEGAPSPYPLVRIFGRANGIKTGEDTTGNVWTALTGSFEGINLQNGESFRSGKLFLPGGIQEVVESAVQEIAAAAKAGKQTDDLSIVFGLEIASVRATNPIGYSYQAMNLIKTEKSDELSELRKAISSIPTRGTVPALPAPAKGVIVDQTPNPVPEVPKKKK